jgi:hypothetical protein
MNISLNHAPVTIIDYQKIRGDIRYGLKRDLPRSVLSQIVEHIIESESIDNPKILSIGSTPTSLMYDISRLRHLQWMEQAGDQTVFPMIPITEAIKEVQNNIRFRTRYTDTFFLSDTYACCDVDVWHVDRLNNGNAPFIKGDFLDNTVRKEIIRKLGGKPDIAIAQNVFVTGSQGQDIGHYDMAIDGLDKHDWSTGYRENLAENISKTMLDFLKTGSFLVIRNFFVEMHDKTLHSSTDLNIPGVLTENLIEKYFFEEYATKVFKK